MVKLSTAKVFVHTLSRCLQCLSRIGKNAFVDNFTTKALSIPALYKTVSGSSGSVILTYWPLKFPIPIFLDMTGCRKCCFFFFFGGGECLKLSQKLHGGDKKHIKMYKKQKTENHQMNYFSPFMSTSNIHISK